MSLQWRRFEPGPTSTAELSIFGEPHEGWPLQFTEPLKRVAAPITLAVWPDLVGQVWVSYSIGAFGESSTARPSDLERELVELIRSVLV